jgi:hypothetical protein
MFTNDDMPGTDQGSTFPTRSVCRNSNLGFRRPSHRPHRGRPPFCFSMTGDFQPSRTWSTCVCAF